MAGRRPAARYPRPLGRLTGGIQTSTCQQMAAALGVSRNTVKTHLRSIYQKLCVASRAEAIERAVALRLL